MPQLSQEEIAKYWEIFSQQQPSNGLLSGDKMFAVLKNSQLDDSKLEKVWDLADIDGDGNMDFEEFCIAMRLVFDLINNTMSAVPASLPDWLVPASKRHLVTAKQALSGGLTASSTGGSNSDDYDEEMRLSSNFNWYLSPQDRRSYENIYSANADPLGYISFSSLGELYSTLEVPDTDISSAWNLVNPSSNEKIDKEQCMVFLHMLNQRSNGVRIPRSVPASLRATFGKQKPSYDINSEQAEIRASATGSSTKKGGFGDNYLSRLGLGGRSQGYQSQGTDFSSTKDTDWEEVRLQRELADLNKTIEDMEASQAGRTERGGSTSLVRRELQLLQEYKEKQLADRRSGSGSGDAGDLRRTQEEIDLIAEQVDSLRDHLRSRQQQLEELNGEIAQLA